MIVIHLGFNDRLIDKVDLQDVLDLNNLEESEHDYNVNDSFDEWIDKIHPTEREAC